MKQRNAWLTALVAVFCGLSNLVNAAEVPALDSVEMRTTWTVTGAAGMDALLIIGAVGGDVMQGHIYAGSVAYFRENLSTEGVAAMDQLDAMFRQEMGRLTGPSLAHLFSTRK